jgi:hypothetical protein
MHDCNGQAVAEAAVVANLAKAQGITVFTVAIGTEFSTAVLSSMSTTDTDPAKPHFFLASSPTAMQDIYASLGARVVNWGGECTVTALDAPGDGATVRLYKGGTLVATTVADASGSFVFPSVAPGTYTFSATMTKDTLTYDVPTIVVGGPDLPSAPSLVVPVAQGTYSIHLALRTAHPPSCGGI